MAIRVIKNYTENDYIINDLGDIVIPAHGAIDIGGPENRLIELASSDGLLAMLAKGADKYQVNNGLEDLSFSEGIDLIRRIDTKTQRDQLGRWIVRSDSRRKDYDTMFVGIGDDIANHKIGGGTPFRFDFDAPIDDPRWVDAPTGYKKQRIEWRFIDPTYVKEGTIYFFDAPKGSYFDFKFLVPQGYPYYKKFVDPITADPYWESDITIATEDTIIGEWVLNHWVEGSCPAGDYLTTEAAHENPSPSFVVYRCEIAVPEVEGYQKFHGHFSLEIYKGRTIIC